MPKSKEDWLKAGLGLLVSQGVGGLTIDGMCQFLGVTKGSFYHHFKNLSDFKKQLLSYWQQVDTQGVVDAAAALNNGAMGIDGIIQIIGTRPAETANPELAIRAWAMQDEIVREFVEQVDQFRIQMMQDIFTEIIQDEVRASLLARMLYAMLVGSYSIIPPIERDGVLSIYSEFKQLL